MQANKVFHDVSPKQKLPDLEREIMRLWAEEGTYQRSLAHREGGPRWVFYEGPPTANGRPGTHHIAARAFKDLFPRYRTMKGCYVERKAGWDTHGLPVELEVEKRLGISGKQQIEEFGIEEFNRLCRESVYEYVGEWRAFSERMAFWLDYDDAYWTLSTDYIQSVWWALKTMYERGLIYKGFRVAPYCTRCATPLSSHELAQGWQENTPDPSIYVRFRLKDDPATSILAWTTTPWTVPGNVALAVGPDIDYVKVRQGSEYLILAEARVKDVIEGEYEVVERMKGSALVDLDYEPIYAYLLPDQRAFYVVGADFVSTDDGAGVVHTAAAYGVDDLRLCQEKGLPVRHTVDLRGRFRPEVDKFAGLFVKEADPLIVEDLRQRGLLYKAGEIRHTYPFCWRCRTPLIYYALDSWYIRTTDVKDQLLANNDATGWVPAHVKKGRMGDWLENNVDWALSRSRYWGTPLPFWICEACDEVRAVSTAAELGLPPDADLHRPYIDEVRLSCDGCGGQMVRVPDVIDGWFDSGSMPFAQRGYPLKGRAEFEATFPADFICEALDQTRGWFYSLLAIATILFGQNAYRNVICLGLVLDPKGQKSSKSRGNVQDPNFLFDEFGSDALRWFFYTSSAVGENYRTGTDTLQEVVRQFLLTLWNVYSFFVTYANIDGFEPGSAPEVPTASRPVLDRWLLSRLSRLVETVDGALNDYDVNGASRPIQAFVEDLSNWYVRRSRRRFWKSVPDDDKLSAYQTLHQALVTLSRLLAPFIPFLSDAIHRNLSQGESAHLADFPEADPSARDVELERGMSLAREAVVQGLAARDRAHLKVRQPLRTVTVEHEFQPEIAAIIAEELNVKEVRVGSAFDLDTEVTPELRREGMARDAVRLIQERRKRAGLNIEDRIVLFYDAGGDWQPVFERFGEYIRGETLATTMTAGRPDGVDGETLGEGLWIGLKRAS
jgi:isoleucyl-tRNA synthetase